MKRTISAVLMIPLLISSAGLQAQQRELVQPTSDYWHTYASKLPIGATVRVRTSDGTRRTGVLTRVDGESVTIQPRTRVPEPPLRIRFAQLEQLEPKQNGSSVAKAVAIGAAVGAGTFFGMLMLLAATAFD